MPGMARQSAYERRKMRDGLALWTGMEGGKRPRRHGEGAGGVLKIRWLFIVT
jgi:hypothetical protein